MGTVEEEDVVAHFMCFYLVMYIVCVVYYGVEFEGGERVCGVNWWLVLRKWCGGV